MQIYIALLLASDLVSPLFSRQAIRRTIMRSTGKYHIVALELDGRVIIE